MHEPLLSPAINGTGVILHTGLGRAVLPDTVREAMLQMAGYCTIEVDIKTGKRGSRHEIVTESLCALTGAQAAAVVNNNAAAVMLILNALAHGGDVIVSRGQLVEIGGSFRMPDVMAESGARLVSVGAVNNTTIDDYRGAITDDTSLLMAVHRSNFEVVGEDTEVTLDQLVALGRETGIPVVHDLGSGALVDLSRFGLQREMTVQGSIASGVSVVCFSGDKLLGGPQAGIIVGEVRFLDEIKSNPLMRALRVDKLTFAALSATLDLFNDLDTLPVRHPVIRMLAEPMEDVTLRADALCGRLQTIFEHRITVTVEPSTTEIGGGTMPSHQLPTRVVVLTPHAVSNHRVADLFRHQAPPVFGRLHRDRFLLDARTLTQHDCGFIQDMALKINAGINQGKNG